MLFDKNNIFYFLEGNVKNLGKKSLYIYIIRKKATAVNKLSIRLDNLLFKKIKLKLTLKQPK